MPTSSTAPSTCAWRASAARSRPTRESRKFSRQCAGADTFSSVGCPMIGKLRVAHKLLLIYLLSLVSALFLVYSFVSEKEKAISFAEKEVRGSAYTAAVREAMITVAVDLQNRRRAQAKSPSHSAEL